MANKSMGSFLSELRKEKGITQKELAEFLNVSDKTVSHWECDKYSPDISVIPILAEFFGVTCDELLKGERNAPTYKESSFSYEPIGKESEYRKYTLKALQNAYGKLKITNVIAVFTAALMWAVLFVVIQLIDRYIPIWDFEIYAIIGSAIFSAALGAIISISAYHKFTSKLNMCDLSPTEHKTRKKKAFTVCLFPIVFLAAIALLTLICLLPAREIPYVDTQTMPLSDYLENEMPYAVDPSEVVSGEAVVSVQDEGLSQEGYVSGEIAVTDKE
ncbi:MAG: helix-turn-helix transcriptional regulator [Clostridia bacterium]|nr:helix-turn-helix transcriptional regulator [Clostridia bacterium]